MQKLVGLRGLIACVFLSAAAQGVPIHLRCDYLENPLGIDATAPHLSWQSDNSERNWRQVAYQLLVASTAENLKTGNADVWVGTGTETSYVVALHTKMAPEPLEPALVNNLVKDIESKNWHLSTGFLGTPFLLATLADHGRTDVAYRLLLNDTYPSWGYMLSKGATTWWERWNGDTGDPSMNSYNHYAFGSVVAWVYRYVAGIDTAPDAPGFRHIVIHPRPDATMPRASGEYESVYGKISTDWSSNSKSFSLKVTVPANTSAAVYLPAIPNSRVTEGGSTVEPRQESGSYVVEVGSGSYDFKVE
jgi:alpha-L-rhamnosidase